ncbi:MAG: glycerol kinase GlpK [Pseudomonadota bacterium]
MGDAILAIDQGTTSSRSIVFSSGGTMLATAQEEFPQIYPAEGHVEHDPEAIWSSVLSTAQAALKYAESQGHRVMGIGITNQRETIVVWDRKTGKPIYNAIVWQDRRTSAYCTDLADAGHEALIKERTGLLLDPYFSASKLAWILDHVEGARNAAEAGNLAAGTIDTFLVWRLTGGKVHATDATNACRTSLFNIHTQEWDDDLLNLFSIPRAILPDVRDSADDFGTTDAELFGKPLNLRGVVGDQQGATVGQACFAPGSMKATYGTGCFVLANTGDRVKLSEHRLLSTVAYRINGETTYALEGSIFIAGAAVQWLRDELGVLDSARETAERAARAQSDADVIMVPAFTGIGAPHWSADARGAIFGMTRATGPDELARAALEGVIYQTNDLIEAMKADGMPISGLSVDGGMVANDWFVQQLADILGLTVSRPKVLETTALGAAYLAFLQAGVFSSLKDVQSLASVDRTFSFAMGDDERAQRLAKWKTCVDAVLRVAQA